MPNSNEETCPGCGKPMRFAFFESYRVDGTKIDCCSKRCAEKCKEVIDRGNVIFKCHVCSKWLKRPRSYMKTVKRPTCSRRCSAFLKKRLYVSGRVPHLKRWAFKTLKPGDVSEPDGRGDDPGEIETD